MQYDLLLAADLDGLDLAQVLQLALVQQGLRRQLADALRPREDADVNALDVLRGAEQVGTCDALRLEAGIERAQTIQLDAHTLRQQLGQALRELGKHAVDTARVAHQSVLSHVVGQTTCVQEAPGGRGAMHGHNTYPSSWGLNSGPDAGHTGISDLHFLP